MAILLRSPTRRLTVLVLGFLCLASVYNIATPVLEAPDEGAHVRYVHHLRRTGRLPDLEPDKVQAQNESWQPPLYYVLGSWVTSGVALDDLDEFELWRNPYWRNPLTHESADCVNVYHHREDVEGFPYSGSVLAIRLLRLLSTCLGAVTLLGIYGVGREMLPNRPHIALAATAVVGLNPQFLFTSATVSNDNLAVAMSTLALWTLARGWRRKLTWKTGGVLGLVSGLAALSKASALVLLPLAAFCIAAWAYDRRSWKVVWVLGLAYSTSWAAVAGWWFLSNWLRYGHPLGWDQMLASSYALIRKEPLGLAGTLRYVAGLLRSFWGIFGYGVVLPNWIYGMINALALVGVIGCLSAFTGVPDKKLLSDTSRHIGIMLILWLGLLGASLMRWMQVMKETNQGRLMFPALASIGILLAMGWSRSIQLYRPLRWLACCGGVALALLAILSPFVFISPAYAHPRSLDAEAVAGIPNRCEWLFGEDIELVGYDVPTRIRSGESVRIVLYWRAKQRVRTSYKIGIRVLGRDSRVVGSTDTIPYQGRYDTILWKTGQVIRDEYRLQIAQDAKPSLGKVLVLVSPADHPVSPLTVTPSGENHALVGPIKIVPSRKTSVPSRLAQARFADQIALVDVQQFPRVVGAGRPLSLGFYWRAEANMESDYTLFVHVLDSKNRIIAQSDGMPLDGQYPTSVWDRGEVVYEERTISLPESLDRGEYRIWVGWYLLQTGERLSVTDAGGRGVLDRALSIGTIGVE